MTEPLTELERKAIAVACRQIDTMGEDQYVVGVEVPRQPGGFFGPHDRVWVTPHMLLRYILEEVERQWQGWLEHNLKDNDIADRTQEPTE